MLKQPVESATTMTVSTCLDWGAVSHPLARRRVEHVHMALRIARAHERPVWRGSKTAAGRDASSGAARRYLLSSHEAKSCQIESTLRNDIAMPFLHL